MQDWANKGMLLDITNLVTMYNPVEYCMIEDRMDEEQIQEFRINGKYYALPTYSMAQGLVYNKDLFDECGFYIAAEKDSATGNIFVSKTNPQKSVGPDGIPDTYDDGLPVTYEEFYELCEEMASTGVTPMAFANVERDFYMGGLFDALVANDSGAYLAETNYTMSAWTEMDLVSHFKDGTPVLEKGMIVPEIGYEAFRQVEKYNALKFMEVLRGSGSHSFYYSPSNYFWSDAQKDFIINPFIQGKYSSAMLVDGVCWHEEAKENFETTKNCYGVEEKEFSFGWMPLPRSSRDKMGEPNVYLETTKGACFIKSTVSEVEQVLAKEFIRFFYTDREMTNFTKETEAPWAMWYGSDSMKKVFQEMSFFGQSLWDFRQNASVVYARESVVGNYTLAATCGGGRYSARVGGTEYKNPIQAILTGKVNAEDYFDGMYQYNRQVWNNIEWS